MKKILLTISALTLLFASSCDSNSSNKGAIDISGKTKQEVFMLHSWELISWLDSSFQDKYDNIEPCMKDDVYAFISTNQFEITINTKCNPSDLPTVKQSWSMASENDTKVTMFSNLWDISSMTGEQIILRRKYYYNFGGTTDYMYSKIIFKKH